MTEVPAPGVVLRCLRGSGLVLLFSVLAPFSASVNGGENCSKFYPLFSDRGWHSMTRVGAIGGRGRGAGEAFPSPRVYPASEF